jgi:hypothetical protein
MILEVDRTNLHQTRLVPEPSTAPAAGAARMRIDTFALTSNNVTYGAFGDMLGYWNFFPAEGAWGRIPVWGFADVADANGTDLDPGTRVYGYFPMAEELVVEPGEVNKRGFTDLTPHRQAMAATYNKYTATAADPAYEAGREGQEMVLWPLFFTAFLIDDYLDDNDNFGAATIVVSSASSKTASATAYLLHERAGLEVVGLTSAGNRAFVEGLGCYHRVVTYDEVDGLAAGAAVYVDIAGNGDVRAAVHTDCGDALVHSMIVGGTHWDHQPETTEPLAGPDPAFFFAPTQIAKRNEDWGTAEVDRRVGEAWRRYSRWTDGWLQLRAARGPEAVEAAFRELLAGKSDPKVGYVCSMHR